MKNVRRGLGRGLGCGYKNIAPMDSHIHSLSAKGVKTTYKVTAVAMNRITKKQIGKPRTEVINVKTNILFKDATTPKGVEERYEAFWNDLNPNSSEIVKVINIDAKRKHLYALGKVWDKVVKNILPHETRVKDKIANTLRDDEINTVIATMEYWGASDPVLRQAYSDMKFLRYRMGDWIGMFIQNEGYDKGGGETATRVLAHSYIKADGNIDKFIQDLRETDYESDRSWEKIDLRQK